MSTGRTVLKYSRFYADGYDLSGFSRSFGPLDWTYPAPEEAALSDGVKNSLLGQPRISVGTLNGFFDNTATSGIHAVMKDADVKRVIMCPIGIRAEPAAGDPVFCGEFEQMGYYEEGDEYLFVSIPFSPWSGRSSTLKFHKPWGALLNEKAAKTAANSGTGIDDRGAASSIGGYFIYQVFAGDGTATLSVDDSADNASFLALSGATSGVIDCSTPKAAIVPLTTVATVRRYLRWQIALGTATTVTYASAFVRA